jgi:hypothetical protein
MHKESVIINCDTLLHVSILLGHLQGELLVIVTLRLHFVVECECAVDLYCVVFGGVNSLWSRLAPQAGTTECNLSVTITKSSPWRWPSRVETCRNVLQLMIKLSLCICWWLVFLYNIVHGHETQSVNISYRLLSVPIHTVSPQRPPADPEIPRTNSMAVTLVSTKSNAPTSFSVPACCCCCAKIAMWLLAPSVVQTQR